MEKQINFNFPDFVEGFLAYELFFNLKRNYPFTLNPDTRIHSIYGTLTNSVWNGGSVYIGGYTYTHDYLKKKFDWYNDNGVAIRIIATNPLVQEHHLKDTYANMIMQAADNGMNEVVVCSPLLEDYLRDKYPNFRYVKSIIASYEENKPVDLDDKYFLSCMMRAANNKWSYLDSIPMEKRDKVEFLCTDPCPDNCPRIKTHYHSMAESQITLGKSTAKLNGCSMNQLRGAMLPKSTTRKNVDANIELDLIRSEYIPRNYSHFKISGRFNVGSIVTNIADYLIKPEFHKDWYGMVVQNLCNRGYSGWMRCTSADNSN